jgi:putative endonuclease
LDLVAREGETLVFIEVRTRRTGTIGHPEESVTPDKQRRIASAARCWLAAMTTGDPPCRFDVVAVELDGDRVCLRHHRDAFRPG